VRRTDLDNERILVLKIIASTNVDDFVIGPFIVYPRPLFLPSRFFLKIAAVGKIPELFRGMHSRRTSCAVKFVQLTTKSNSKTSDTLDSLLRTSMISRQNIATQNALVQ